MLEMVFQRRIKICECKNRVAKLYEKYNIYKNEVMNDIQFIFDAIAR